MKYWREAQGTSVLYNYINDSLYTRSCKQTSYISPGDGDYHIELHTDQRDDGNIDEITDGSGDVGDDDNEGGSCSWRIAFK